MKCIITKKAYLKMKYFVEECNDEISGFGKVKQYKDEDLEDIFKIYDIEILKQTVTGASAIIDEETIAKFLYQKTKRNIKTSVYRVWWHSHATMGSFFSVTDDTTINQSTEFPYLISIVSNHKHEIKARIDIFSPIRISQIIELIVEEDDDEELRKKCIKDIEKKVKYDKFLSYNDEAKDTDYKGKDYPYEYEYLEKKSNLHDNKYLYGNLKDDDEDDNEDDNENIRPWWDRGKK